MGIASSLPTNSFSREVGISFARDASFLARGTSPVVGLNEGETQTLKARSEVRGQAESQLRQLILEGSGTAESYCLVENSSGLPIAYTPQTLGISSFGGVYNRLLDASVIPDASEDVGPFSARFTYTWSLPGETGGLPTLVHYEREPINYNENSPEESEYLSATGSSVVLEFTISGDTFQDGGAKRVRNVTWSATINGQPFMLRELEGAQSSTFVRSPILRSPLNGAHTLSVTSTSTGPVLFGFNGTLPSFTESWSQRGLVLANEYPDPPDSADPVAVLNSVSWSDGEPLADQDVVWKLGGSEDLAVQGKQLSVTWDPISSTYSARAATSEEVGEDLSFEDFISNITVETDVYEGPDWPAAVTYILSNSVALPSVQGQIKIIAEPVNPNAFTPEEPDAILNAEVVTIGLPADAESGISWTVDIKDPSGTVVKESHSQGFGCTVQSRWDGVIAGQAVENPGAYFFCINAKYCEDGGIIFERSMQDGVRAQEVDPDGCPVAFLELAMKDMPVLKIFDGGNEIANSEDRAVLSSDSDLQGFERLGKVNEANSWTFELSGISTNATTLSGFVAAPISQGGVPTTFMLKEDQARPGVYILDNEQGFDSSSILKTGSSLGSPLFSTASGAVVTNPDTRNSVILSHTYAKVLDEVYRAAFFPQATRKALGQLVYTDLARTVGTGPQAIQEKRILPNEADFTKENLQKLGFEAVEVTVLTPAGLVTATVKVQNKASHLATFCHGLYSGELVVDQESSGLVTFGPDDLPDNVSHIDTWLFNACSVLVNLDYNNNHIGETELPAPRTSTSDSFETRLKNATGIMWWEKMRSAKLLGYSYPVDFTAASAATTSFSKLLDSNTLKVGNVSIVNANREQLSWLVANFFVSRENVRGSDYTAWNACAWDLNSYYFLPIHREDSDPTLGNGPRNNVGYLQSRARGIAILPLDPDGVPRYVNEEGQRVPILPVEDGPPESARFIRGGGIRK